MFGQLPFPMDCLYADPNREVISAIILTMSCEFPPCLTIISDSLYQAYDVLGLYYGVGRTFFNPASVIFLSSFSSILAYIYLLKHNSKLDFKTG